KGITLVEIMVSLGLIALLGGSILALLVENMRAGQTADYNYAAVNIAKSRIDRVRQLRRDKGFSYLYTAAETDSTVDRNGLPDAEGEFTRSTSITQNFESNPNLTKVEVTVKYKASGDISTTSITLTSLMSPYI
ncbi:MAG: hypothetical protein Q8R48_04185, partial [Candidatus Omnitrophota bacterium]|nr:hypothetical protein [Candidatus Omnitrophota bacterium]